MRSSALFFVVVAAAAALLVAVSVHAGSFTQRICADPGCSVGCTTSHLEQNVCYTTNKGDTATGTCQNAGTSFLQTTYPFSQDCSGISDNQNLATHTCYASGSQFIMFTCPDGENENVDDGKKGDMKVRRTQQHAGAVVERPPVISPKNDRIRQFAAKK